VKLLVLGASGFVGSNIIGPLADLGYQVYAVQRKRHVQLDILGNGVRWVGQAELFDSRFEIAPDAILSLAGIGEPAAFENDPAGALAGELAIADTLAALVCKFQVPRVIYLSSGGAVYGEGWDDGRCRVFDEGVICHPLSTYGKCKLASEERLSHRLRSSGLLDSMIILRASNVYGLHYVKSGRQGLINALVERSFDRRPVPIYGDGLIYRDYLFGKDLASAIDCALQASTTGVFNIAAGRSHNILEVLERVERAVGAPLEKRFEASRQIDVRYSALSVRKAASLLKWQSSTSLESGIAQVVQSRKDRDLPTTGGAMEIRKAAAANGDRLGSPAKLPEAATVK
jgi:UDP-glucose 4-epimerase